MPLIIDHGGKLYSAYSYPNEKEFEAAVVSLSEQIFGTTSIYIDVKRRVSGKSIVTVPDGYVIDMADPSSPRLFMVENEIVRHDPFRHIGIQMLKFATSFDGAQTTIRGFLMDELSKNPAGLKRLEEGSAASGSRNIDNYLDKAVYGSFHGVVVIDEARPELYGVLEKINADISVLELQTYVADDGAMLHQFDTLYDDSDEDLPPSPDTPTKPSRRSTPEERAARRARRAVSDTIVVPAREDGFKKEFLTEHRWFAIRIGAAMKERIKYIAVYQVAPVSAVTHIAEIQEIRPYKDTGKYLVVFKGAPEEIPPVPTQDPKSSPQGPVYVRRKDLLSVSYLEEALS